MYNIFNFKIKNFLYLYIFILDRIFFKKTIIKNKSKILKDF